MGVSLIKTRGISVAESIPLWRNAKRKKSLIKFNSVYWVFGVAYDKCFHSY